MAGLLVHEWVEASGGAERVVDEFLRCFPDSDVQVLWDDTGGRFGSRTFETWIAKTALRNSKAAALPFLLPTWRTLKSRGDYEWMLVSSHLFAHHARLRGRPDVPKYVYAHTPARYIWEPDLDSRGRGWPYRIASAMIKPIDRARAREATSIAANSSFTAARIRRTWGLDPEVIYPPVDVSRVQGSLKDASAISVEEGKVLDSLPSTFLLGASRFVPYKQLESVISVGEIVDFPVVLTGSGPEEMRLREIASNSRIPVYFVIKPSDALLFRLYSRASCLVFPAIEDFGIMPVEAMAAGTPVIGPSVGGASESVLLSGGGVVVNSFRSRDEVESSFQKALTLNPTDVERGADMFSAERFRRQVLEWVGVR